MGMTLLILDMQTDERIKVVVDCLDKHHAASNEQIVEALQAIRDTLVPITGKHGLFISSIPSSLIVLFDAFLNTTVHYHFTENIIRPGRNLSYLEFNVNNGGPKTVSCKLYEYKQTTEFTYEGGSYFVSTCKNK